jgi:radical SAM-linked protein
VTSRPVPATPPPAPVAQRLVVRYAKRGRMRFASHRDVARAVERGVRRACLPIAFSAGFSPHPKISYAAGAPTGAASEAEYLELALTRACAAPDVRHRLNDALPDGIDVIEVHELGDSPRADSALRPEGSQWRVVLPGVDPGDAARAVQAFLAAPSVTVERLTTKGTRRLDARAAVVTLELDRRAAQEESAGCATLRMVVRHLTPAVRPDDVLAALSITSGAGAGAESGTGPAARRALVPSSPPLMTRLAQGPLPRSPGRSAAQEHEKDTRQEEAAAAAMDSAAAAALKPGAYDQLPRGAEGPGSGPRAREDDGRLPGCSTPSDMTQNQETMREPTAPLI